MRYLLPIFLIFVSFTVVAQKDKVKNLPNHDDKALHFGFNIGFNAMDFKFEYPENVDQDYVADIYDLNPSILVSIVSNARLTEHLDVRFLPGICFGQREIAFINANGEHLEDSPQKITSNFLDFPLLLKYKADRINNFRPYLISGMNFRYDLASKKSYDEDVNVYLRLKPTDFYYEIGFGFDSYLQYFKLSTEFRYSIGLNNVLVDDKTSNKPEFVNAIDKLFSRVFMVCFYFE